MTTWKDIDRNEFFSCCGGDVSLQNALDGTNMWEHLADETHYFILDLGNSYTLTKAKGRSLSNADPVLVNIYVSDTVLQWGTAVATNISTWQDTSVWQEVNLTPKLGRYVKVEITRTENSDRYIRFGGAISPFKIFDVGYEVSPPILGQQGDKWRMVSIGGTQTVAKEDLFFLYNGTYYTWAQATTNDNEEGTPLVVAFIYGWDVPNQCYTNAQSLGPWEGYWMYHYFDGVELYVNTNGKPIICIPGTQINIY